MRSGVEDRLLWENVWQGGRGFLLLVISCALYAGLLFMTEEGPFSAAIFALLPRDGGQADGVYFGRLERASSSLRSSDFV